MNFYWVNLRSSFDEVMNESFLWTPKQKVDKNGKLVTAPHWKIVQQVKKGDLIFGYAKKRIMVVAEATSDAYSAQVPASRRSVHPEKIGTKVDVLTHNVIPDMNAGDVLSSFGPALVQEDAPRLFDRDGKVCQIYMTRLQREVGLRLLGMTHLTSLRVDALVDGEHPDEPLSPTTREAIIAARVGQGKFRQDLIKYWEGQCAVTSLRSPDLLIASHIKRWEVANNAERLDPANGLLLSPNLDKLFDKNLISFDDDGKIILSSGLDAADRKAMGVSAGMKLRMPPSKKQRSFLAWHRQKLVKSN